MGNSKRLVRSLVPAAICALATAAAVPARAQVFVVEPSHIDQHYATIAPTDVKLSSEPMTTVDRERLVRYLESEQGFAIRPLPISNLDLRANGQMDPEGEKYIDLLHDKGMAAKPGDRVVITDIKIRDDRIVIDLNNGPEHKHKYLRHISIGMDPYNDNPVVEDDPPPTGSRVTLMFPGKLPDMTGEQVEELLKPVIDFGVKSQAEAYAESLPDFLRKAILEHRVLVGMDQDMVLYAKGEPIQKFREQENGKPVVIWMYGKAPDPVEFVRFHGDFAVRVEIDRVGQPVQVQAANEMGEYWGNTPAVAANQHPVEEGDRTEQDIANENVTGPAPSLKTPGEKLPTDTNPAEGPINWPPDLRKPGDPGYTPPAQTGTQTAGSGSGSQTSSGQSSSSTAKAQTSTTTQPGPANASGSSSATSSSKPGQTTTQPPATTPQQFVSSAQ
ncbi:MAG: hypothetical protein WBG54_06140 [Acidobacteriaceae bacterium]